MGVSRKTTETLRLRLPTSNERYQETLNYLKINDLRCF